ncbi:hypothetical protein IFM89_003997 [Coptis chinensis]|uniref:AAA+ ATPase domain-containing protein n=1 Tax=Coptis chinensis TaxID=261450 RepID=A0A835GV35_9MAGN|nr:hypothetical protein IFM89_003997 [Coptis chinensis]
MKKMKRLLLKPTQSAFSHSVRALTSSSYSSLIGPPTSTSNVSYSKSSPEFCCLMPAVIASFLGMQLSYADANNEVDSLTPPGLEESTPPLPELSPPDYVDVEKIVKQERKRLEELLKNKGMQQTSYPRFVVAMKGQKVSIKFQIPPDCEVPQLIVDLISHLGLKAEEHGGGSDMVLRAWNSTVAWQMTLHPPEMQKGDLGGGVLTENKDGHEGNLCEIEFIKQGSFSPNELDALVSALKLAGRKMGAKRFLERRPTEHLDRQENPDTQKLLAALEAMGVRVFGIKETHEVSSEREISWDNIAGYHQQKREIEDTILLALHSPKVYDDIARGTRRKFESNRPRAVLFEGPPGTGKTSCARVIANQAGVPLLYVPLEAVMSKYYGESERLFGTVFSLANGLPEGAIIFLDEIDSFASSRDDGMHEATRRILSVLLRQIDGFEQEKKVVVIAATNRKEDLDPALIRQIRFDSMIEFGLPDQQNRQEIAAQYAKHLKESELVEFAAATEEMSGRDIRDVCQQAERHWASKIIRGQVSSEAEQGCLPPLQEYIDSALTRRNALLTLQGKKNQYTSSETKKNPMELA